MRLRRFLATAFGLVAVAMPAVADLPCPLVPAPPVAITAAAFLEEVLGVLVQNGISLLFAGAVAVVGVPWMMAGLAMALLQLLHRKL
jgi:hypothetical protein